MAIHPETLSIAIREIERFEGIELEAYLDPIGVPTICAGLTRYPNGLPVRMGDVCTAEVCKGYLRQMLSDEFVPSLSKIPGWSLLGPKRQATLLSFAWNLGSTFYGAPGFETISRVLREGAERPEVYKQMGSALSLYVKAGGQTLPGLVSRRKAEGALWDEEGGGGMEFTASQDTFLKRAAIDSRYLSELGKRMFSAGETISVSSMEEIPANAHAWVQLDGAAEKWAIFLPHWREKNAKPAARPTGVNWQDFSCSVGKYITVGEVLQYDARRAPRPGSPEESALLNVCKQFDEMRVAWNGPLGVTSGYRPEPINSQVGGVPGSYHTKGMALDIYPVDGSLEKFHQWLIKRWSGGYGDGRHKGFIHVDTRNGGAFHARSGVKPATVWTY